MLVIDFKTAVWLVYFYYSIGTLSLILNCYTLFLVIFKSEKIDSFKYYLFSFQCSCLLIDINLSFLMQPQPLHPIPAGFCTGILSYFIPDHYQMVTQNFLIITQLTALTLCFFRKFMAIKQLKREEVSRRVKIAVWAGLIGFNILCPFSLSFSGVSKEKEYEIIRRDYPDLEAGFRSLPNFTLYEFNNYWLYILLIMFIQGSYSGNITAYCTKRMLGILKELQSSMSAATFKRQKTAVMSLIAQLCVSVVAIFPPVALAVFLIVEFKYAQETTRFLLAMFSTHSTVNAIVLIITTPPFRKFTFFWTRRPKVSNVSSVASRSRV